MKLEPNNTKKHFDRVPKQWDAFYSHENRLMYMINRLLRKGLYERYRLTFEHCGDLSGARVLDIGCGTGRYSIECAKRGAGRVVGIDFAPSMIEFCRERAEEMGVADKCEFICGDFLQHPFDEHFDVILALGFFDYVENASPILEKIAQLRPRRFIASFPKLARMWSLQRRIRYYWIKKCPVYDYSEEQLERLYRESSFRDCIIIPCARGFFGVAGT
ncbi:MAG: class I SAM-dependent methyltransferase [Planctomycetota bacterium]|jgi:2-polyprenyl-3-methyl-5-hydroxy-6-metoxy-1,4-benzoquinol methylase